MEKKKNTGCGYCPERARLLSLIGNAVALYLRIEWNGRNGAGIESILNDIKMVSAGLARASLACQCQTPGPSSRRDSG
jgi:hypothetical protein